MDKTNLIFDLLKEGKISNEQAKVLLEKETVYVPTSPSWYRQYPNYWYQPYTITCGTGSANATQNTLTCSCSN